MDRRCFLGAMGSFALLSSARALAMPQRHGSRIIGVRIEKDSHAARFIFELNGDVRYREFALSSPPRVVLDIDDVGALFPSKPIDLDGTPVAAIRHAHRSHGIRVVFDMRQSVPAKTYLKSVGGAGNQRLVVQFPSAGRLAVAKNAHQAVHPITIAIDAGHGGKDPGAVSTNNHYEKDVVFAIASKLYALLEREPGFKPEMTRTGDYFLPLHERVVLAHRRNADMFMSIHADAAPVKYARGASVYVLSEHGATSTMARWLATSENSADRYESARDRALYNRDPVLSKVLVDMSMDATILSSLDLGRTVIKDLSQVARIHQHHVDQAAFAVLKSPDIPSILVETGFMSNREDCRRLLTKSHQEELADSLKSGITSYFRKKPIHRAET